MSTLGDEEYWLAWAKSIAAKTDVSTLVFLQLGSAFMTTVEALKSAGFSVQSVDSFLDGEEVAGERIVLTNLESLATSPGSQRLGKLRVAVQDQIRSGRRFVLQSRAPRLVYDSRGSLIVMDAVFATGPSDVIWAKEEDSSLVFEAELDKSRPFRSVLKDVLGELGQSICARLDRVIYESGDPTPDTSSFDGSEMEALRGAALIADDGQWRLPDPVGTLRRELTDVLDVRRDATVHLSNVVAEFDAVTAILRRTLRAAARARWGPDWASECLPQTVASLVVERASSELVPLASSIYDIRDVLLWLTVRELLELRRDCQLGGLGMNESAWKAAERDLGAVEDRLRFFAHLTRQDEASVKKWSTLFHERLSHNKNTLVPTATEEREALLVSGIRTKLEANPAINTQAGSTFLSLVTATVRFLKLTADVKGSYTRPFEKGKAPRESELQEHYFWYLGATGLGDSTFLEVPNVSTGRVDILFIGEGGARFVTEVKRELQDASMASLADSYFGQAADYQVSNEPLGQLLVLDLTHHQDGVPGVKESIHVETRNVGDSMRSLVFFVVRGNRAAPSGIRSNADQKP